MSVLQKLFHKNGRRSSKQFGIFGRKPRTSQAPSIIELPSKDGKVQEEPSVFVAMPPPDVRLVLFQEFGDTSDRRLLFDSKTYEPQTTNSTSVCMSNLQHGHTNNSTKSTTPSKPYQYNYVRGPQDMEIISEMLFGSVGMASRASSLKIHIMKNPQRLMLSRVFCVESSKETVSLDRGMDTQRPVIPVLSRRKAKTLPVPTPEPTYVAPPVSQIATSLTSRITRSDSSSSLISLLGASLGVGATGSLGSRSIPQQIPSNRAHSLPPVTKQGSRDSFTLKTELNQGIVARRLKVKIGFAVMFEPEPSNTNEFQRFFFEHFPLIESYLTYLKEQVESALNTSRRIGKMEFVEAMMEALHVFTLRLNAIYSTPRLPRPVWSSLTTSMTSQGSPWQGNKQTMVWFISELARTVDQFNTKQKNHFMSGLITSVLTHHLGWVNTTIAAKGDDNSQTVAYNPLWAQLGDLYGAVGTPTKVAKTIVVGEIHEIVSTIVSILSYFIRCSNVKEVVDVPTDMTPQAFSNDDKPLSMSYVPSDLEKSDYVLVTADGDETNPVERNDDKELRSPSPQRLKQKPRIFQFCRKNKHTEPIEVENKDKIDSSETSTGSTLCRSRSSPGTAAKPQVNKFVRQKSSGNFENFPPRVRTNSNDAFARPRGVQSRRTSREVANSQRMCQSSTTLFNPDLEKIDGSVSSVEGSKSLCLAPVTPSSDLRKRLGNDDMGSCPNAIAGIGQTPSSTSGQQIPATPILPPPKPQPRLRTHKRVSSEPFKVNNIKTEVPTSTSLVKTQSTYFPVVRQTFVDRIEPKVVNVGLVQRSQPVRAMQSPVSSPLLPRSKSSAGQKGPIMGFKTNEYSPKMRLKHSSGSSLNDSSPKPISNEARILPSDDENSGSKVGNNGVQRSASNVSVGSTGVRRSSSAASAKMKLAGRRRRLTDSSKTSSIDESDETIQNLPPLQRIPSISLEHDEFDEYFKEEGEPSEFIFFSTQKSSNIENQSCIAQNQSSGTKKDDDISQRTSKRTAPPIPSTPPCVSKTQPSVTKNQPTVTDSIKLKAENHSSVTRKPPPPLPAVGPYHRSQSTKAESVTKTVTSPTKLTPKSAPPLPAAPPVHHGSLYPKLESDAPNSKTPLPKYSLYPNLNETSTKPPSGGRIYPSLDQPPPYKSVTPETGSLYPKLPGSTHSVGSIVAQHPVPKQAVPEKENPLPGPNPPNGADFFRNLETIPLHPVEFSEENEKKSEKNDDKLRKLTFGELLADYSPDYLWGFALHGTKPQTSLIRNVCKELEHSVSRPVLDEPVAEAVSIVADTDKWSVRVLSSHRLHSDNLALPAMNSKLVTDILDKIRKLYQMSVPAEFCVQQLENSLGELVLKSRMLAGYVNGNTRVTMPQLSAVLGIEKNDLPLLMAIASCHSPEVAAKLL